LSDVELVPSWFKEHVRTLLEYNFNDELKDWCMCDEEAREHHIINTLVALDQVVFDHRKTVEQIAEESGWL
jgi:hypothetical protein